VVFPTFTYDILVCCLVVFLRAVPCRVAYCYAEPALYDLFVVLCSVSIQVALEVLCKAAISIKELVVVELVVVKYPLVYKLISLLWASHSNME
jgi:hypothetical protein